MTEKKPFAGLLAILLLALSGQLAADPWAAPGDLALRSDIQRLADAGLIKSPVTTWPIPWATIDHDLRDLAHDPSWTPELAMSLQRVRDRLGLVKGVTGIQPSAKASLATDPFWLRTFEDTPREEGEYRAGASWQGGRFAARVQVQYVDSPVDGENWRMDGAYASVLLGNQILSAGMVDRWWGPGWDNSLIYSSNARPVEALTLERNVALPFETKWLSWIGPWSYSFVWGFLGDNRVIENARLMAFRVAFRPTDDIEIGLSRSAIWCGSGRPCDFDAFGDIVVANDNTGESGLTPENDPSNQLAAWDLRWQSPIGDGPYALYTQWVANDEVNNLPSQWAGQVGAETWGTMETRWLSGDWRAHLEVTSTVAEFWESDPAYDGPYNHGVYLTGYRYEERSLGAAADGDSIVVSLGGTVVDAERRTWSALVRWENINKNGDGIGIDTVHSVSPDELKQIGFQVSHRRPLRLDGLDLGTVGIGLGYQHVNNEITDESDDDLLGFVNWTWDLSGL